VTPYFGCKHWISIAFVVSLVLMLVSTAAAAGEENGFDLDPARSPIHVNQDAALLQDPSGALDLEDVQSEGYARQFRLHGDVRAPGFSYTDAAVWVRLQPQPDAVVESPWVLEVGYPLLTQVTLYYPQIEGTYARRDLGSGIPFDEREIAHRNIAFNLPMDWDVGRPLFLRVRSDTALVFPLSLWESRDFLRYAQTDYAFLGVYYGIIALMALHAVLIWYHIRRREYLYYAAFIGIAGLFFFSVNGLAFQYLWPGAVHWSQVSVNVFLFAAICLGVLCVRRTLPVYRDAPWLDRAMSVIGFTTAILVAAAMLLPVSIMMRVAIPVVFLTALAVLLTTATMFRKGSRSARYQFLGWCIFGVGVALMAGRSMGWVGDAFVTLYGAQLGLGIKALLFLAGMADQMRIITHEKEQAERRSRRLELQRQKLAYVDTLNTMFAEVSVAETPEEVADKFLDQLSRLVPFDRARFFAEEAGALRAIARRGDLEGEPDAGVPGDVPLEAMAGEKVRIVGAAASGDLLSGYPLGAEVASVMVVPVRHRHTRFGAVVAERDEPATFGETERRLAEGFALQGSVALENSRMFQEVRMQAITDALTGLYNRRYLFKKGDAYFVEGGFLSLLIMDLDDFKGINDALGHVEGDRILRVVAGRCARVLRKGELACRYGGEEFAFLLPGADEQVASKVAERLRRVVCDHPVVLGDSEVHVTASFGVAFRTEGMESFRELFEHADRALRSSKEEGKNQVTSWSSRF